MTMNILHYVHDPLCGWCYAAEPLVFAAANSGVRIVLHGGGLWEPAQVVEPEKRAYVRTSDERIGTMTGQHFGSAYLDGLLKDPTATWWSRPTIAAVIAAEQILPDSGLRMIAAIQDAHYVKGLRVVTEKTLADVAASFGIEPEAFITALRKAPVDHHIERTRELMRKWDLRGFPSFLVEHEGRLSRFAHEPYYGRPAEFVAAIAAIAAVDA